METMNKLFDELWWFSDDKEVMSKFVEAIKNFTESMKGNVYITLIDLFDFGYRHGYIYIAYDDLSGGYLNMFPAGEFIKYYKEVMNDYPDIEPQKFWIPKLQDITEN